MMIRKFLLTLVSLWLLAGCASTNSTITINPNIAIPQRNNGIVNTSLSLTSADQRADKALAKINRDGQLVVLTAAHDPRFLLQEALERQLTARGYRVAANSPLHLQVAITRLYADVSQGDFRYHINSQGGVAITVTASNGKQFTQNYQARYSIDGAFQASNQNIANTLNIVLSNIMTDMANDNRINDFIRNNS